MKLHLPKQLFTALLAAITLTVTPAAWGLTLTDGYHKTYSLSEDWSYTANDGKTVAYNATSGLFTGYDLTKNTLTLNMQTGWSSSEKGHLICVDANVFDTGQVTGIASTSIGLYADEDGSIVGSWEGAVWKKNDQSITSATLASYGKQASLTLSIAYDANSDAGIKAGVEVYNPNDADTSDNSGFLYYRSGLRSDKADYDCGDTDTKNYLNAGLIDAIVVSNVTVEGAEDYYYASNYNGSWAYQFAKQSTRAIMGVTATEVDSPTALQGISDIVVGSTAQLYLNAADSSLVIGEPLAEGESTYSTSLFIGHTMYKDGTNDLAAIRFGNTDNSITVNGNIYLVDSASMIATGTSDITINGTVTDKVADAEQEVVNTNSTLSLSGTGYNFTGSVDITGLRIGQGSTVSFGGKTTIIGSIVSEEGSSIVLGKGSGITLTSGNSQIASLTCGGNNTITLESKAVLDRINSGNVVLKGDGVYNLGSNSTLGSASLDDSHWKGAVQIGGTSDYYTLVTPSKNADLNQVDNLVKPGSRVILKGVRAWVQAAENPDANSTISANIDLINLSDTVSAWNIHDGYSRVNNNVVRYTKFTGNFTGTGDIVLSKELAFDYRFSGNLSGWSGNIKVNPSGGSLYLTLEEGADTIGAGFNKNNGSMYLTVNTTNAATFSNLVTVNSLDLSSSATFEKALTISGTATIGADKTLTVGDGEKASVHSINTVNGTGGIDVKQNASLSITEIASGAGALTNAGSLTVGTMGDVSGTITLAGGSFTVNTWNISNTQSFLTSGGETVDIRAVNIATSQTLKADGSNTNYATHTYMGTEASEDGNGYIVHQGSYILFEGLAWDKDAWGELNVGGFGEVSVKDNNTVVTVSKAGAGQFFINNTASYDSVNILGEHGVYIKQGQTLGLDIATGEQTLSTNVEGEGALEKTGAGTLTLSGTNTYSGGTTVAAGTLSASNTSSLGSGAVTVQGGAELEYTGTANSTLSSLKTGDAAEANSVIDVTGSGTLTVSALSGANTLEKTGSGTLTAAFDSKTANGSKQYTYTGKLVVSEGTFKNGGVYDPGTAMEVSVGSGAVLDVNGKSSYFNVTMAKGAKLTNTGDGVDTTKKQIYKISLTGDATVEGSGNFAMLTGSHGTSWLNLNYNTLTKKGGNTWWLSRTTVETAGKLIVENGTVNALKAGSGNGVQDLSKLSIEVAKRTEGATTTTGTFQLSSESGNITDLVFNGGTVKVDNNFTLTATGATTVKSTGGTLSGSVAAHKKVSMEEAASLKLDTSGNGAAAGSLKVQSAADASKYVALSGAANASAAIAAKSSSALIQLQQDATFTIQDMTLTNTSISAATVDTKVSFDNVTVSGAVVLKNLKVAMSDAQVADGGSEGSKGTFTGSTTLLSGITMSAGSSLTVDLGDLSSYAAMGPGKYDLSITLSGFSMADFEGAYADSALQFAADSWLGQLLAQSNNAGVQITIAQAEAGAAAADAGGASTGVSYSTGNVGTIITINGLNVPEPTTSTLSLLALAGLCARRRRKD